MSGMMPLDRGRTVQGQAQVVLFSSAGECFWMEIGDARRALAERPTEYSKEPFAGKTYGAPRDVYAVTIFHGGAGPLERPWNW
ncbi:hypothetical protein QE435_004536 [Rhizobium sp. SORGH_AS 787]|nr:hypothetical protein [Rhizobium sp. SORGH_AS_0787]